MAHMRDHGNVISRDVNVRLERMSARIHRSLKRDHGVLGISSFEAAMGDRLGHSMTIFGCESVTEGC